MYFHQEANSLQVISAIDNPSLIKPIATYTRGDALCFVFPWANGGNLREFWASADQAYRTSDLVLWVLSQLYGLAGGLNALYGENCRHGDLKPENILRFTDNQERGTLLIADMGLTRFHVAVTQVRQARQAKTATIPGTRRYEPPEVDDRMAEKARSRDYDVWSMGCIFLEFLIWLLEGQASLEEFNEPGNFQYFWENHEGAFKVHSAVESRINRIAQIIGCDDPNTDTASKDLHNLIRNRLLKVKLLGDGWPKNESRANAPELVAQMEQIYTRAREDKHYLSLGRVPTRTISSRASATLEVPLLDDRAEGSVEVTPPHLDPKLCFTLSVNEAPDDLKLQVPIAHPPSYEVSPVYLHGVSSKYRANHSFLVTVRKCPITQV